MINCTPGADTAASVCGWLLQNSALWQSGFTLTRHYAAIEGGDCAVWSLNTGYDAAVHQECIIIIRIYL